MKVGEFFVQLGVKADTLTVKDFGRALGNLPVEAAGALAALSGMEFHLMNLAAQAFETATGFRQFEAQTGLSAQKLQTWQNAAQQVGVSAETVAATIGTLQSNIEQLQRGRGNFFPWWAMGVTPTNAFDVMKQLRKSIKGMDKMRATNLLREMGIDPQMMLLLELSDKQFDNLARSVHGMSKEQIDSLNASADAFRRWHLQIKQSVFDVVSNMTVAIERSEAFKNTLTILGAAIGALVVYLSPLAALAAGVAALAAALNDIAKFSQGRKSITGDLVEGLKELEQITTPTLLDKLKKLGEAWSNFGTAGKLGSLGFLGAGAGLLAPLLAPAGALMPAMMGAGAGNKVINQTFNVNVSSLAEGAPGAIREATQYLKDELRSTAQQINNQEK